MKRTISILAICLTVLIVAGVLPFYACNSGDTILSKTKIKDTAILRTEILKSIHSPFVHVDTFIIETSWKICGNSTEDEIPITIDTKLEEKPSLDILAKQIGSTIITMKDFNKIMDTILKYRFHEDYPESLYDTCRINKVHANIRTEKSKTNGNILVYEDYLFADTLKRIFKEFYSDNNDKWHYKINQSFSETLKSGR
jgi:flagellar biosynthesis component FlhA